MDRHVLRLTEAVNTVVALLLYAGVPPAGQVDDMRRGGQGKTSASGFGAEDEKIEAAILAQMALEAIDDCLALRMGVSPLIRSIDFSLNSAFASSMNRNSSGDAR